MVINHNESSAVTKEDIKRGILDWEWCRTAAVIRNNAFWAESRHAGDCGHRPCCAPHTPRALRQQHLF